MRLAAMYAIGFLSSFAGTAAFAAETITYQYDALGRLVRVVHNSGSANGVTVVYSIDPSDNRSNVTVTGGQ